MYVATQLASGFLFSPYLIEFFFPKLMQVCDNLKFPSELFNDISKTYGTNCLNGWMMQSGLCQTRPSPASYGVLGLVLRSGLALAMPSNVPHLKYHTIIILVLHCRCNIMKNYHMFFFGKAIFGTYPYLVGTGETLKEA